MTKLNVEELVELLENMKLFVAAWNVLNPELQKERWTKKDEQNFQRIKQTLRGNRPTDADVGREWVCDQRQPQEKVNYVVRLISALPKVDKNKVRDIVFPDQKHPEENWKPTAENINSLPKGMKDYVCRLETNADPAGMVRENTLMKDENEQLKAKIAQQRKPEQVEVEIKRDTYAEILSLNAIYNTLTHCQKCDLKADYEYLRQVLSLMQSKPVTKVGREWVEVLAKVISLSDNHGARILEEALAEIGVEVEDGGEE